MHRLIPNIKLNEIYKCVCNKIARFVSLGILNKNNLVL